MFGSKWQTSDLREGAEVNITLGREALAVAVEKRLVGVFFETEQYPVVEKDLVPPQHIDTAQERADQDMCCVLATPLQVAVFRASDVAISLPQILWGQPCAFIVGISSPKGASARPKQFRKKVL